MDALSSLLGFKSLSTRATTPSCWIIHDGDYTIADNNLPCGGSSDSTAFCCAQGDECTEDSICHFTHSLPGTAGYYIGGCTDPTFNDPVCSKQCTEFPTQDITYNSTTGLWACCYTDPTGSVDCSHPGNQTFQALPLTALSAEPSYGATLSSSSHPSSTSSSLSIEPSVTSHLPTSTTNPNGLSGLPSLQPTQSQGSVQSQGLSTGAKVGIAVPVAIVGLAIIGALIFFLRRRSANRRQVAPTDGNDEKSDMPSGAGAQRDGPVLYSEIGGEIRPELDGKARSELQARSLSRRAAP